MTCGLFGHREIRASAGSGKTHQLTNRYLALLAAGVEPDTILATTFTRKAAGEILDRVLYRLAEAAGDADKAKELAAQMDGKKDTPEDFVPLLRRMVHSLHRVRIGTLDSFFITFARSFSLELGLPAGWSICEQGDDDALQRDALERLLEQQPEDISKLFVLLNQGETKRPVQEELRGVIRSHYECFRGSERTAWECLHVPASLDVEAITAALDKLRAFDFSGCRDKRFFTARDTDVANFECEDWLTFVDRGLAKPVLAGAPTFQRKSIPQEVQVLYEILLQHARSQVLRKLADQTRATGDLLDRFHRELLALKQATGKLRFGEVTQTLVDGLKRRSLRAEEVAFRLDGAVEHLLLDEFQDTSLPQWRVLEPIAQRITEAPADLSRSFFCVGDVKQAIYGWRGGMAEISDTLQYSLGALERIPLVESRRSAQPIVDVVNNVFCDLRQFDPGEKYRDGLARWAERFDTHKTVKQKDPGYVCLHTGPAQDGQSVDDQRGRHCRYVAEKIADLTQRVGGYSIGVLCRKNDTVARMIYELRQLSVRASDEAGNPLTDSPAAELILSLFTLADHPGHSVAWFHLLNSPLQKHLESLFADPDTLAHYLRRELLTQGYGQFTYAWAKHLAPACAERDLNRLQQLVDTAYAYQSRSTLRTDDFVAWVRQQRVLDPSAANVRVMTIHAAKGLEFDAVVLPELDARLMGQTPMFIVGRDPKSLDVNFVCRYAKDEVQQLLAEDEQLAFAQDRQQSVEESLSLLYVAVTRAKHALYLFIPGPRDGRAVRKDAWYKLLQHTLAPTSPWTEFDLLYKHGDANWFKDLEPEAAQSIPSEPERQKQVTFRTGETDRRRGLEHVAPSRREGQARVVLDRLFNPSEGTGLAAGTLYHAWFETIDWLDDGMPSDAALRAAAEKLRNDLSTEVWRDLDRLLATFRAWLRNAAIAAVLRRAAYVDPHRPGFPAALAPFWTKTTAPQKVERERRFLILDGTHFWNGSLDRVVWLGDGDRTVAADVLDYKTDDIPPGNAAALAARTGHYRPQLEAYRRAVARLAQLPAERVATRLVFTAAGCVVDV